MFLRTISALLVLLFSISIQAQVSDNTFKKEWGEIDSLMMKAGLPKSALEKVKELTKQAKQKQLNAQVLKSLIYQFTLEERITSDNPNRAINNLKEEIAATGDEVQKAVLYSLLAKQYNQYYTNHRWDFYNRKTTVNLVKEDMSTWGNDDFTKAIRTNFLLSIHNKKRLQEESLQTYAALIIKGNNQKLRPTLYDLLVHEALTYFSNTDFTGTNPVNTYSLNEKITLAPAEQFIHTDFTTKDSNSTKWMCLQLFQELMAFHKNDIDKDALVQIDLERIEWIYPRAIFADKESVYKKTLESLISTYPKLSGVARAWFLLAKLEADKAQNYNAFTDTTNRYGYRKAKTIIDKALAAFPESNAVTDDLQNLLTQINTKILIMETEKVNVPYKPFRALIRYRNTDTLYTRIIRIDNNDTIRLKANESDFWKSINKFSVFRSLTQALPSNTDNQAHAAEMKIDGLPVGEYAILCSSGKGFVDSLHTLSIAFFYVSNISYIKNKNDFFVLNRENGSPMQDVKVTILRQVYISRLQKIVEDTVSVKTTNKNGYFRFEPNYGSGSFHYIFTTANDRLNFREPDYNYPENNIDQVDINETLAKNFEKASNRIFFFTDRSIYRPGQTVFFKGIAITKDFKTKLSKPITAKDSVVVYLRDANRKLTDSLQFGLNSFGSFTGKFILPQNLLTGAFTIEATKYNFSAAYFSVEEYKRPKFSVTFDKVKGSYRLNDSITVTGTAKALAGNNIDGAKISFNITRNTRFMEPWNSRRPYPASANREISHGEMVTDSEGKFKIKFKALADDITDKDGNPLFDFTIQANVTDINGETRSAQTRVSTGFSSLLLRLSVPPIAESDSLQEIKILTTNLSNEKEPAVVQIKIYPLQSPDRMIRTRYWQQPDQFILSEKEYLKYFPTDEYRNESSMNNWPIQKVITESMVNTAEKNMYAITAGTLAAGYYKIEAITKDKYGEEVKQVAYMQLFSRKNNQLPSPAFHFGYTINNKTEPSETANFISGTSANGIFVISKKEKPEQTANNYDFEYRKAGIKTIQYTAAETDRGGVTIGEVYIFDNRQYSNQFIVNVPWSNKMLKIGYASYRNKTEPGAAEKWIVTIQGNKGEKAAAELLTGMYDASLDQFRPQNWAVPNVWLVNYSSPSFISNNFASITGNQNYYPPKYFVHEPVVFDRLPNNGYEFSNGTTYTKALMGRLPGQAMNENDQAFPNIQVRGSSAKGVASLNVNAKTFGSEIISDNVSYNISPSPTDGRNSQMGNGDFSNTVIRKNFNETAFFFPQLYADSSGKYSFTFTMPEALTQWKWMSLAHTKDLAFGSSTTLVTTQKKLMVQPNAPRFLREGDNMEFSTKIANLSDKEITGQVTLELLDASTNTSVDGWFQNVFPAQYFTVEAGKSFAVKFPIQIPFSFNRPLTWRIVAKAGEFSDGEENTLPVLTNRMLVTESMPLFLAGDTTQHFVLDKLLHNTSESLTHEAITVEYSSNPVWYAVQALPYLMEYPYECAEQTFNRFYANALGSYIVNKHPRIKQLFEKWRTDSVALKSNLQKNEELKQILLQETPWVLQAENEEQQKKNISLLFDLVKLSSQTDALIEKLNQLQLPNGSFSWFKGGEEDRYMTNYILTGIGKLKRLGALSPETAARIRNLLVKALKYMDEKNGEDYTRLVKNKADLNLQQISSTQIEYLYMRSFFRDIAHQSGEAYDYFYKQGKQFWNKQNTYYKAQLGLIYYRNNDEKFATATILPSILENTVTDSKLGMYWKSAYTGNWYQSPIEHQSMMIALMSELNKDQSNPSFTKNTNAMKTWLLLNKQTNHWKTTIATADACYALLLNGSDWLESTKKVIIQLGKYTINSSNEKTEAGTGYFKKRIEAKDISNEMGNITISTRSEVRGTNPSISQSPNSKISQLPQSPSWGSIYWQYFEDLDKITPSSSPLSLNKKLFIERNTDKGIVLDPVKEGDELKTGDKIIVRLELRSDRDMDYLHLKDMRAASMEPVNVLSGYKWQDGLGYYESTKDVSTNFFISHLRKGTYVFDYPLFITHTGLFSVGIASIQCMYAPDQSF
jgi:uncharacterized protein YfaS (alpha-2-macroglobulin family)